jgi:hypothetical protein
VFRYLWPFIEASVPSSGAVWSAMSSNVSATVRWCTEAIDFCMHPEQTLRIGLPQRAADFVLALDAQGSARVGSDG